MKFRLQKFNATDVISISDFDRELPLPYKLIVIYYEYYYSTVTLFARFLGWSTLHFLKTAI